MSVNPMRWEVDLWTCWPETNEFVASYLRKIYNTIVFDQELFYELGIHLWVMVQNTYRFT